jgi:hypothetical protein
MEFTSWDWHYLWIDDSVYDAEVLDGFIVLETTTRESYRFDVSTGEIVEQFRFWRWIARGGIAILGAFGLTAGWFVYRRWVAKSDRHLSTLPVQPARPQFGIRWLFVVTTLTAGLLGVYLVAAHVAILLSSATITVLLSLLAVWTRRRVWSHSSGLFVKCQRVMFWLAVSSSWFILYALSFAPAMALATRFRVPNDVRMVLAQVVYAPVWWLYDNTPIHGWQTCDFYFRAWGM